MKSNEMGGHVAYMGESRGSYRVLVVGPEGKKPLARSSHRWWNNIKLYLEEVEWGLWSASI